jgi:hypothetical protein
MFDGNEERAFDSRSTITYLERVDHLGLLFAFGDHLAHLSLRVGRDARPRCR